MSRLYEVQKIVEQDFAPEEQELVAKLGGVLNPFMFQLTEIINGNIDFENLNFSSLTFEITVDSNGVPQNTDSINIGRITTSGFQVINAQVLDGSTNYPTATPFITFEPTGDGLITLKHISGLQANTAYQLTVIVY